MSFSRHLVLAAVIGCGVVASSVDGGGTQPPSTDDVVIKSVVAHFAKNDVKLEKDKEGNYWVVTDPKEDGYDVIVAWRTWPAKATVEEMQAELKMINLGFLLNAPARVAMSKPGLRSADPAKKLPPLDRVPVVAKLEKLFKDYKPPESPPRDPLVANLPAAARKVFEDTFPGHRCIRMGRRGQDEKAVYRGTFFDLAEWSSSEVRLVGEESVATPPLYHLEVDAAGHVVEETRRPIDPKQLPKAVQTAYEKWNPKGVVGQSGHFWMTEVPRGKARVYHVNILLSAVKAYGATFREDGTVVQSDPAVVP